MNIVIVGAGNIGAHIAATLSDEEHNVFLIDQDARVLERLSRGIDVATIPGFATDWKLLEELRENEPQFFIALTGDDQTNLAACAIAKNLGYPKTIARVTETSFVTKSSLDFGRLFYVDYFIAAELLAAHDILKSVISPSDLMIENFAHGAIQMRSIVLPENWARPNLPIRELGLPEEMIVGLIRRQLNDQEDEIIFPHGDDHLLPHDEVTIVGDTKIMTNLGDVFGTPKRNLSSVVIVGGSPIAFQLAKVLEKQSVAVKIIERDEGRCNFLAEHLPNSTIINHDGKDLNFLLSEKVQDSGAFITCMNNDESNLLISSLGKQTGCEKVISLISDATLNPILRKLDITAYVSEKVKIANRILSIVHSETIISITSLCDNKAKVSEIKVSSQSELIGIPLSDLGAKLPKDLLIAVIESHGKVMIGKGNRILCPGDTVIVISHPKQINEMQYLF